MMTDADRPAFGRTVLALATAHSRVLSDDAVELYWLAMRKLWTLEDFRQAAAHLVRSLRWMPKPSDFELLRKARGLTSGEAWAFVLEHLRTGQWRDPEAHRPYAVSAAVHAIGGWHHLATCDGYRMGAAEKRFPDVYDSLIAIDDVRRSLPQLAPTPDGALTSPAVPMLEARRDIGQAVAQLVQHVSVEGQA